MSADHAAPGSGEGEQRSAAPGAIGFGWGVPSFAQQLPGLSAEDAAAADEDNRAIIRLSVRGLLTSAERDRAIQRATRRIEDCLRKKGPFDVR